jgi:hypothetical protein
MNGSSSLPVVILPGGLCQNTVSAVYRLHKGSRVEAITGYKQSAVRGSDHSLNRFLGFKL